MRSIPDLKLVPDSLPKGILDIFFVSRLNRDAKSFQNEFFHVYLVGVSFSSQAWLSLIILFGIKRLTNRPIGNKYIQNS